MNKGSQNEICNPLIYYQILVRLAGIEPTTPWFVAKYSIQLSYSRVKQNHSTPCMVFGTPCKRCSAPASRICLIRRSFASENATKTGVAAVTKGDCDTVATAQYLFVVALLPRCHAAMLPLIRIAARFHPGFAC